MTDFLKLSQEAYEASSAYIDTNFRGDWEYSLRAFRNEHAPGSKYLSEEYKARSRLFRPKTRSVIRKNEAAAAVALFSNMEIIDLQPGNPDDMMSVASRDAMKAVLEYRLQKTIPTFQICMGGVQDAQVQGMVCSYQYWEYEVRGERVVKDKPCIELRPIENIRLDGGASWIDPVGTSPYFCDIIPMYVCDVRAMMENKDPKTGAPKWKKHEDGIILQARPDVMDTTTKARLGKQQNPADDHKPISSFDIVWVMRWFMKDSQGVDHTYYTLGTNELLTDALPIEEVYFHGQRPYVMGYSILETHKVFKTSTPVLGRPLQQETNDVANQRIDNVKFVLNKRWIVARGRQVDVQSLVRNVPGGVTLATDPKTDVQESNWPDVTSSAYVEQDRLNSDFDELLGNFSPSTKVANNAVNDTLGGSRMAAQGAGLMTDYMLRTVIETWWEPVLRQLILLEQYYETDETVLALCAQKARLFPRYGLSKITDDLLTKEVNISVNVGMGSSNPQQRMQNFLLATQAANQIVMNAPPGANVKEMVREIYSNAGYRDGSRFYGEQQDPRLVKAMQLVQQLQGALESKRGDLMAQAQIEHMKTQSTERQKAAQLMVDRERIHGDLRLRQAEILLEQQRIELERMQAQAELGNASEEHKVKLAELGTRIQEVQMKLEAERQKIEGHAIKTALELKKGEQDLENARIEGEATKAKAQNEKTKAANEAKSGANMDGLSKSIQAIQKSLEELSKPKPPAKRRMKMRFADGEEVAMEVD